MAGFDQLPAASHDASLTVSPAQVPVDGGVQKLPLKSEFPHVTEIHPVAGWKSDKVLHDRPTNKDGI